MQIWAESGKSALPICNYSQILYQFLTFTQNLKRSLPVMPVSNLQYPGMDEDDGFIPPIFSKIGSANFFRTESAPTI